MQGGLSPQPLAEESAQEEPPEEDNLCRSPKGIDDPLAVIRTGQDVHEGEWRALIQRMVATTAPGLEHLAETGRADAAAEIITAKLLEDIKEHSLYGILQHSICVACMGYCSTAYALATL